MIKHHYRSSQMVNTFVTGLYLNCLVCLDYLWSLITHMSLGMGSQMARTT